MTLSNYRKLIGTELAAVIGALGWLYTTNANPQDYHTWIYVGIMLLTGVGTWISPANDPGFLPPVVAAEPVVIPNDNAPPVTDQVTGFDLSVSPVVEPVVTVTPSAVAGVQSPINGG